MKEIKTWIRWSALVVVVLILSIMISSTFSDRYTVRIEASPEVRDIALKYADLQVDLYEIEYNCSEYVEMEQTRAKGLELAFACEKGCHKSFDGVAGNTGAVGVEGFFRSSCLSICLEEYTIK